MSSSTEREVNTPAKVVSPDQSAGFRRWSRNLSAQRNRELKRLNQIERRRQFLELKRQNDLFNQMSLAGSGQPTSQSIVTLEQADRASSGNSAESTGRAFGDAAEQQYTTTVHLEASTSNSALSATTHNGADNQHWQDEVKKVPLKETSTLDSVLSKSRLTPQLKSVEAERKSSKRSQTLDDSCASESDDYNDHDGVNCDKMGAAKKSASLTAKLLEGEKSESPVVCEEQQEKWEHKSRNVVDKSQSDASKPISKLTISLDRVKEFVSMRVPKNKRVLCLIVRDKLSKLNKAKSYFYPTYYLFVQAIVDMDELGVGSHQMTTAMRDLSDDDLQLGPGVSTSADNSFSASSSISADMLFIGAGSKINGAVGQPNTAVANLSTMKPAGSSYSDNEVYADTETEEDYQDGAVTSRLTKQTREGKNNHLSSGSASMMKSASLQGRDSPLVFPNNNNGNCYPANESGASTAPALGRPTPKEAGFTHGDLAEKQPSNSSCERKRADCGRGSGTVESGNLKHEMRKGAELSIDDSNEDGDDLDDDSDNDESFNCKQRVQNQTTNDGSRRVGYNTNEEVHYTSALMVDLFDNERNPYTGTYGVLLAGRRRKKAKTYLIGPGERGYTRKNSICKLKSNVLGTQFNAIRISNDAINERCTVASISYETNVLGFKGPRKMRVFLAKNSKGEILKSLPEMFKKNPEAVVQLKNMTPSWNVESQSYVLNFHGRVTQASVKNFQLIECDDHLTGDKKNDHHPQTGLSTGRAVETKDGGKHYTNAQQSNTDNRNLTQPSSESCITHANNKRKDHSEENNSSTTVMNLSLSSNNNNRSSGGEIIGLLDRSPVLSGNKNLSYNSSIVMQFGRISGHEFTCDVAYPLSILQAFAIALSSFDSKLACE